MKNKVVFLDVDGTLLTMDGELPDSARNALICARANGHQMVLCTGRARCQITDWFPMELLDGMITAAGSCVYVGDRVVYSKLFSKDQTVRFAQYCKENNMPYFFQAEDKLYSALWCQQDNYDLFLAKGMDEEKVKEVLDSVCFLEHPERQPNIEKALYYNCPKDATAVQKELGSDFYITDSSFKVSRFCDGEVTLAGVDKSAGIAAYLEAVGVPREDSIAFGDGPNDLEMIEYVQTGVAMGNSIPALKERAQLVCGNVWEDGLAEGFKTVHLV